MRRLMPVFVASDGRDPVAPPPGLEAGILLRDLDLLTLVRRAGSIQAPIALDLDSVEGLNPDPTAARFVIEELGVDLVVTRRPTVALRAVELGRSALLHVLAFDSTGLARSLEGHPGTPGVGTIVSPGPVLDHLLAPDLQRLPRPLVAYGFIDTPERAAGLLRYADAVVVPPACALLMARGTLPADAGAVVGRG